MRPQVPLLTAIVACLAPAASAQVPPVALTLEDALIRAVEVSHRLGELRAREQAAQAQVDVRRAAERPTVTVNAGYTRTNHVDEFGVPQPNGQLRVIYPDIPDNYFMRAFLQWPIYTAGRLDALERAAEAELRAIGAELAAARADLRLEVTRAFWALVTADESVRVLEEALERAAAHLRDVRAMFENGLIPPNDVALVEAQHSRERLQLIEAQNVRRSVAEDVKRLTGVAADGDVRPAGIAPLPSLSPGADGREPAVVQAAAPAITAADAVAQALMQRPERQSLLERIAAAEDREAAALAARKPAISVSAATDYANPNPRIFPRMDIWRESWEVTASVTFPLWDGGRARAEAAEAAASGFAARERLADLDRMITADVRQRQFDIESAQAAIVAAEDAIRSAQEARRVVAERFRVGVATSTDVLDAQVALLQADLDRTRSVANLRLAEARLERARGR